LPWAGAWEEQCISSEKALPVHNQVITCKKMPRPQ
jgi:hypothetical protein